MSRLRGRDGEEERHRPYERENTSMLKAKLGVRRLRPQGTELPAGTRRHLKAPAWSARGARSTELERPE